MKELWIINGINKYDFSNDSVVYCAHEYKSSASQRPMDHLRTNSAFFPSFFFLFSFRDIDSAERNAERTRR